ncbi:hypothetical protein ASPCADRAFT_7945 [Aspergillus carbonarius ITEM 5010]|uniref:NADPH--hemoprotein reductase n=1 Tax=Aspergillus carbonarius (strain ITEM 5010) TaxID=602072 RepID=A0A1R3RET0_ASPC5|nr:hypothetical protein ASPCADRAFT_7945 [Aspergillus carbonarius ITEM 5010]
MIANGSAIAPFLGFLHHRLRKWEAEGGVGKMLLLYGCRDEASHLYKDELGRIQDAFGGQLRLITAYSRKGAGYVQAQVRSNDRMIQEFLCREKANVYICGSVNMACSVREELLGVIQKKEGWTDPQARDFESSQLRTRRWQLGVWG